MLRLLTVYVHEFRHVLQYYNDFEQGFSMDFKMSKELLADIKTHVSEIFEDESLLRLAGLSKEENAEVYIAKVFVYLLVGGELTAYGIDASLLHTKPAYVNRMFGKYDIFLPWYDAKTDKGRYEVESTSSRKDEVVPNKKQKVALPSVDKTLKYKERLTIDDEAGLYKYVYSSTNRAVTKKSAKGTNLRYFVRVGERAQMPMELQEFVKATTKNEDKLPPEIMNAIYKGVLNMGSLMKWFRNVDLSTVSDFTFNLLNKHIFKNDYINKAKDLERLTVADPGLFWAIGVILRREGLNVGSYTAENDIDKFLSFINSVKKY